MNWLKKYKFKNSYDCFFKEIIFKKINYLLDNNLSNFEYLDNISEEEFIKGNYLKLKEDKYIISFLGYWYINKNMVEKDLKELRKDKLDGMVKKV